MSILATTFTSNADNRLTTAVTGSAVTTYTSDACGRRATRLSSAEGTTTYTWDPLGHLVEVASADATSTYEYGISGMRERVTVETTAGVTWTESVWSGGELVSERDSDFTTLTYVWGPDRTPLAVKVASYTHPSGTYYYHTDAAGSVVALTDESGEVAASYAYDAFGALTDIGGSDAWLAGRNPLRYRAYYADDETGLYYLPARYYEPSTARFLSPDPAPPSAGDPLSLNAYTYCQGDPVNASDPTGAITDYDGNGKVDSWDSSMSAANHTSDWMYAAVFRSRARRTYSRAIDLETRRGMAKARLETALSYRASQEWSSTARIGLGVGGAVLYAAGTGLTSDGLRRFGQGAKVALAGLAGSPEPTPAGEVATAAGAGMAALGGGEWLLGTVFESTGSDLMTQARTGRKADLWVTTQYDALADGRIGDVGDALALQLWLDAVSPF